MDAIQAFKTMLEELGYKNVKIAEANLPQHIIEWGRGDDTEMTDEDIAETMPYFKVTSEQGSFGILMGTYLLIDLKDTGFNSNDLGDEGESEEIFLASLNDITLRHLRKLFEKRKRLN